MYPRQEGDSSVPLLRTKLFIPIPRTRRVERPRLIDRLDAACPLTLVSAPAGFGKTTLVSDWLTTRGQSAGWLSLDPTDSEPRRFLTYLAGALSDVLPGVGDELVARVVEPQLPPLEALLTPLINELSRRAAKVTLVLDDYHVIDHVEVHAAVAMLVERLPPGVRLVVTTRADPPWTLARWRARGMLRELRTADLRFQNDEIVTYLAEVMDLAVKPRQAEKLGERTEGWIAGLQLAALSLRGQQDFEAFLDGFTGSHRYVFDYLAGEVLTGLAPDVLDFLLTASVVERFCGPLCDALTGRRDGQSRLEALEAENLFIVPLDEHRTWYRFHHLFRSVLLQQLEQRMDEAERQDLHRRACDWLVGQSMVDEALEHALAARDQRRSLDIVEQHAGERLRLGDIGTVTRWFDALPSDWAGSRARLVIDRAHGLFLCFRWHEMAEALEKSRALLDDDASDLLGAQQAALECCLAMTRAAHERAIQLARKALAILPEDHVFLRTSCAMNLGAGLMAIGSYDESRSVLRDVGRRSLASGNRAAVAAAGQMEGQIEHLLGRLDGAFERYRQTLEALAPGPEDPVAAFLLAGQADVFLEWGDPDRALELAKRAIELSAATLPIAGARALVSLAGVHRSRRDPAQAMDTVRQLEKLLETAQMAQWEITSECHRARVWCLEMRYFGDEQAMARLAHWVDQRGLLEGEDVEASFLTDDPKEAALTCALRLLLTRGEDDRALELLGALRAKAEARGWRRAEIETWLLEAEALHQDPERARAALRRALELAAPEGYVQVIVDEDLWLRDLLTSAWSELLADLPAGFQDRLKHALRLGQADSGPLTVGTAHTVGGDATDGIAERLSARELEVLAAVAEGLSNVEAGKRLHIASSTVKKHLENIYGKLGAHNRVEAISRCRALGLLVER